MDGPSLKLTSERGLSCVWEYEIMWKKIFGSGGAEDDPRVAPLFHQIDRKKLPRHVAVIMDGNGRWAQGQGLMRTAGHTAGVKTLKRILRTASDIGIEALTVYAFSTENWKRPHAEVDFLMGLFSEYLDKELREMHEKRVRIHFLGRREGLSHGLQEQMREAENLTRDNGGIRFNIAANYGGQDEILRAIQSIVRQTVENGLSPREIDEGLLERHLDTFGCPPVDLVIRTSGDMRLSNFLLWQSAYAELWFTKTNWPDFTPEEFVEALVNFGKRDRRFGGLNEK